MCVRFDWGMLIVIDKFQNGLIAPPNVKIVYAIRSSDRNHFVHLIQE